MLVVKSNLYSKCALLNSSYINDLALLLQDTKSRLIVTRRRWRRTRRLPGPLGTRNGTSTRSHVTPPSPPCAARCAANSARHGDGWLVGALIGSLHPFLFPSLSLLSRAFALPRLQSPIPIMYCFLSFFVTLINYSFYTFRHVNIN